MKEVLVVRMVKEASKIVIISHQNSDVDAVLSCYVAKRLINRINPSAKVHAITPGMNLQARKVVENLGLSLEIQHGDSLPEYDLCLFVDVNNPLHLGSLKDQIAYDEPIIIIDHHRPSTNMPSKALAILDERAVATAEVLCDLMVNMGMRPSKEEAQCLLIGILSDSRRLSIGSCKTMQDVAYLLSCGASLSEAVAVLSMPMSYSEKIARLKALQRTSIYSLGQWVIAVSNVGSYEASAARALVDLGADLAAVCNEFNNEVRVCTRANEEFVKKTGLHLGEVMDKLSSLMSGSGGGHASAACATVPKSCNEVVNELLALISSRIGQPIKKVD